MNLTVSLAQSDIVLGDPAANLKKTAAWIAEAARRGSQLVVLPELWTTGYDLPRAPQLASTMAGGAVQEVAKLAARHQIWVAGSMLVQNDAGRPANRALLYSPQGEVVAHYDKIHRFGLMNEDRYLDAGTHPTLAETPWGATGLAICYDLRFPELWRSYALAGAVMVLLPSEWPHPRLAHWRTLIRARAIENQLFVLACNRVGRDADNTFCGHSAIIDPRGETLAEGGEAEILLTVTLNLQTVAETRRHIPILQDRRPDCYRL